ncbi:hypothetical protein [Loigolactobacillus zhaoyuanensis]|uniref:Uncharacterized protein n=1 Tax=Loigolactobacillus zhaoyuanensis TaxID=2486017 RepID=A0ABW8UDC8_9LACO|nr:hypothetical protein [Loigolactobacillus zhaoyuanensis]
MADELPFLAFILPLLALFLPFLAGWSAAFGRSAKLVLKKLKKIKRHKAYSNNVSS